jgi:hypothetical protein
MFRLLFIDTAIDRLVARGNIGWSGVASLNTAAGLWLGRRPVVSMRASDG